MNRVLLVLLLAFTSLAIADRPKTGKLTGHVSLGPISPVERPGHKQRVPPEMYKHYQISVTQPGPHNGMMKSHMLRVVATLKLTSDGDFSTDLPPGEYRVEVRAEPSPMHLPPSQTVTISAGKTTRVTFSVDTGIR
jgi:hypothetical protein